jgi:hypothetical protein
MSLEELAKLRNEARAAHVAAREARAAYTAEVTQLLAAGQEPGADLLARGDALTAAVNSAQAKFKQVDKQHLSAFKAASAPKP